MAFKAINEDELNRRRSGAYEYLKFDGTPYFGGYEYLKFDAAPLAIRFKDGKKDVYINGVKSQMKDE